MAIPYFPGCTLATTAKGYDRSGRAVAQALGIPLAELPDWQCCGATFPLATDNSMAFIAPTRILTQAQKAGGELTALCAICFHVLRRTQYFLDQRPEMLERINWFTGEPYEGKVHVSHFLELLRDRVGWQKVTDQVTRPLEGLKVAPYYGCLLLRPQDEIGMDDADHPRILHDCLSALGAEVVDFPYQDECCGSYLLVSKPELPQKMSEAVLGSARKHGAQAIVTACPLCQFNLDHPQARGGAINLAGGGLPVLYFTQLMAVALGLPPEEWGLDGHAVDPLPLFADQKV